MRIVMKTNQREIQVTVQKAAEAPYENPLMPEVPYHDPQPEISYDEPMQPEVPYRDIPPIPDPMVQPTTQPLTQPSTQPPTQPGRELRQFSQERRETGQDMRRVEEEIVRASREMEQARVPETRTVETKTASSEYVQGVDDVHEDEEYSRKEARIREILEEFLA